MNAVGTFIFIVLVLYFDIAYSLRFSSHSVITKHALNPVVSRDVTASINKVTFSRLASFQLMAASRGGGGTQLDSKTVQKTATKPTYKEEIEKDWRLILHDDPVHTIQQVVEIVNKCCPLCSGPRAYEVTLEVHMTGAGTIAVANKKIISEYSKALQAAGLTVSMAPDDEFEDDDE